VENMSSGNMGIIDTKAGYKTMHLNKWGIPARLKM